MAEDDKYNPDDKTLREILSLEREITTEYGSRRSAIAELQAAAETYEETLKTRNAFLTAANRTTVKALEYEAKAAASAKAGNKAETEKFKLLSAQNLEASKVLETKAQEAKIDAKLLEEEKKKLAILEKAQKEREGELNKIKKAVAEITGLNKIAQAFSAKPLVDGLFGANEQAVTLSKQFGISMSSARGVREEFEEFSRSNTRFDAERLTKAQQSLGKAIGQNVLYSDEMAADFVEITQYMGVSEASAGRLAQTAASLGVSSEEFRSGIANSLAPLNKSLGINLNLKDAYEEIGKLSTTTLVNLGRNPQKLLEAVATAKRFGIELEQLKSTASSLLDFETSIASELEAEVLTGKNLNLERARLAALRGDEVTLMQEMAAQAGNINEFENMNVIQRESLAKAFGMNVDQMGTMLMRQEAMTQLSGEASKASDAQLAAARELMKTDKENFGTLQAATEEIQKRETAQRKFEDSVRKLKTVITDTLSKLEPVLDTIGSLTKSLSESPMFKWVIGAGLTIGAVGALAKTASLLTGGALRGQLPALPLYVSMGAGGGMGGGLNSMLSRNLPGGAKYGQAMRMSQAGKYGLSRGMGGAMGMKGVLGGAGLGLAGMGVSYLGEQAEEAGNESLGYGLGVGGSALEYAGMGAMIGSIVPGVGTAVGAGVGAIAGALMGYLREEREDREKEKEKTVEQQEKMSGYLQQMAERSGNIYMDGNQVGLATVQSAYRMP